MQESQREIQANETLSQVIIREQRSHPQATGQMTMLLHAVEIACKYISSKVRAAGMFRLLGAEGSTNVQGEIVKKLDVVANDAMITALTRSDTVSMMVSEENPEVITVKSPGAHYVAVFDPLDGSSNIDANVSIGTIFGVYQCKPGETDTASLLCPGREMVAAGYCVYGSATVMVLTTGHGVNGFTLDPSTGEFVLTHPQIKMPNKKAIYSINEGYSNFWYPPVVDYMKKIKTGKEIYSLRYVGSMVADVHRTLLYGGIFMYPPDTRSPEGKLRLLYEAFPMAMLVEQAGGKATNGRERILDIHPTSIHQRTPVFLGSVQNINELEESYKAHSEDGGVKKQKI